MAAYIVLTSRFPIDPSMMTSVRALLLDEVRTRYLIDIDQQEILQLRAYKNLEDFSAHADELDNDWNQFSEFMTGDVHRELLQYVEAQAGDTPS